MTHPAPETLVPYALGAEDASTGRHIATCPTCRAEVERLREAAGLLRGSAALEHRLETPDCLDELTIAEFVEGRLSPAARAPAVAHLLACARCRSVVTEASQLAAPTSRRRWPLPLGLAAAAALLLLLVPRHADDGSRTGLREPPLTSTVAPVLIAPRAAVGGVDRLVWSSVPHAQRYQLRLYDGQGTVVWRIETTDTFATLPHTVRLSPRVSYFWRVEAQTEWRRWAASDLVEFRIDRR